MSLAEDTGYDLNETTRRSMVEQLQQQPEGILTAVDIEDFESADGLSIEQMEAAASWAEGKIVGDDYFDADEIAAADLTPHTWSGLPLLSGALWPNRTVKYGFHPDIVNRAKKVLQSAMKELEQKTCITFEEVPLEGRDTRKGWVEFISSEDGCWANVGSSPHHKHRLNLDWMCRWHGVALHELLHVIGITHEQKRYDRDEFVEIKWDNIKDVEKKGGNFAKSENAYTAAAYDYRSIMHYGRHAFSKNVISSDVVLSKPLAYVARTGWDWAHPTIKTKSNYYTDKIGQRSHLSNGDVEQIIHAYQCSHLVVKSEKSIGAGFNWIGGPTLGSGHEQVGVACTPGLVMTSCSCWQGDGDCRGALQTSVAGTCLAGGQKGWQVTSRELTARAICLRLSSPSYVTTRMSDASSAGGSVSMTCGGNYKLVGCSCMTQQEANCDATPSILESGSASCAAKSSKPAFAQAVCLRAPAMTSVLLVAGSAGRQSTAECPAATQLTGCSCAGATLAQGLCAGARAAGHASNVCNAHAKQDDSLVIAYALCATMLSNKDVWMPAVQVFSGGKVQESGDNEELNPVQSVYCTSWGMMSVGRGCKSIKVQNRKFASYRCPENLGESGGCSSLPLHLTPSYVDVNVESSDGEARCPVGWVVVKVSCADEDCKRLSIKCAAPPPHEPWHLSGGVSTSEWFSGETNAGMGTCGMALVIGVRCNDKTWISGDTCQHVQLLCRQAAVTSSDDVDRRGTFDLHLHGGSWSNWISSTGPEEAILHFDFRDKDKELSNDQHHPIQKVQCDGGHCDDLRFHLVSSYGWIHKSHSLSGSPTIWTVEFSDTEMRCPDGHYVASIKCEGSFCMNKKLLCAIPDSDKWLLTGAPYYSFCFTNEEKYPWSRWARDMSQWVMGRSRRCAGVDAKHMPDMQSCGEDGILVGIKCFGKMCARLQLICRTVDTNVNLTSGVILSTAPLIDAQIAQGMYNSPASWSRSPSGGEPVAYHWTGAAFDADVVDLNLAVTSQASMKSFSVVSSIICLLALVHVSSLTRSLQLLH